MKLYEKQILLKWKSAIAMLVAVTMLLSVVPMMAFADTPSFTLVSDSTGTYYPITTAQDLVALSQIINNGVEPETYNVYTAEYRLMNDIDMSSVCSEMLGGFTPIGKSSVPFKAHFNGNGKTISNLYVKYHSYAGLFGYINGESNTNRACIENLTVQGDVTSTGRYNTNILAGYIYGKADIQNIMLKGTVNSYPGYTYQIPKVSSSSTVSLTDIDADEVETKLYGYTYTKNGHMAYLKTSSESNDVSGRFDDSYIKTTYNNVGYEYKKENMSGASIDYTAASISGGRYVKLSLTVKANAEISDGKLGIYADVQVGDNDEAAIEAIKNGDRVIGIKMVDDDTENSSYGAQFSLYFANTAGVADVDTYWFGFFNNRQENWKNQIDSTCASTTGEYDLNYTSYQKADSGFAVSWQDINLAKGETKVFSIIVGVGEVAAPVEWGANALSLNKDTVKLGENATVTASIKDTPNLEEELYVSVDSGEEILLGTFSSGTGAATASFPLKSEDVGLGTHSLTFWVMNEEGAMTPLDTKTFTVAPMTAPTITFPTVQNSITYGQQMKDIRLSFYENAYGTFNWTDPDGVPLAGTAGYALDFYPNEEALEKYDWANGDWIGIGGIWIDSRKALCICPSVVVNKADAEYTLPQGVTATYGDTLADVDITQWGSGWSWKNDAQNVGDVGKKTFVAVFTPNDTTNYKAVDVNVEVTVEKAPLTVKANDANIIYGDAPANNGVTYSGFIGSEAPDILGGTLRFEYNYAQYDNVGTYDIEISGLTSDNYEITFVKGTLTVAQKEIGIQWDATEFLPYTGESKVPGAAATGLLNGDTCTLTTVVVENTQGAGIIPGRWTAKIATLSNSNYKLPESGNLVQVSFGIVNGYQSAPSVSGVAETIYGKADGTITGLTTEMEYATEYTADDDKYTKVTRSDMTFASGTYYVRYCAKQYYNPSAFATVTIDAGRKLTVTVPQNQVGYTLTVDKNEIAYMGGPRITLHIADGYSKTNDFAVKINGKDMNWGDWTEIGTQSCTTDIEITVEGVADVTAPIANIDVADNKWTSFLDDITFGLFFKEAQTVTINATDHGSGLDKIYYFVSETRMMEEDIQVLDADEWTQYDAENKPSIAPDKKCVVYVKAIDKAQNVKFISSDGLVFDGTAPGISGMENGGTYYGMHVFSVDDALAGIQSIEVDGKEENFSPGEPTIYILPDNAEHSVTVTDKAGNETSYTITVYKMYTVTYKIDGETVSTEYVGYGKDATLPSIPSKKGYDQVAPTWDKDGKNITADTEINAIYTKNPKTDKPKSDKPKADKPKTDKTSTTKTGDNSNLWLWAALLFVSGGCLFGIILNERKRKMFSRK